MKKKIFVSLCIFSLFLGNAIAEGPNMKEGLWEMTMRMKVSGMPMQMPSQTYTHCITKEDMVPQKEEPNQECKMVRHDVKGDTVTWIVECKGPEGITRGDGRVTYKGDTFEGIIKMSMTGDEMGGMDMTQHLKGRWIGQCTE